MASGSRVFLGAALALWGFTPVRANAQGPPCGAGDTVLSLGKAAFYRSIERGAFAIGERTLEDLTDGLGGTAGERPTGKGRRGRPTPPAQSRAAGFPPAVDARLSDALLAYVENPSSEAGDAVFETLLQTATKILFETLPERTGELGRVGLVLEAGQFQNRSSTFAVHDVANESLRLDLERQLFGDDDDLTMGKASPLLTQNPFFETAAIADAKNLDRNNLGLEVKTEQELRTLWFETYGATLEGKGPTAEVEAALNAGWPIVQKFWALKRTGIFIDRALAAFSTELRQISERAAAENLPAVCGR